MITKGNILLFVSAIFMITACRSLPLSNDTETLQNLHIVDNRIIIDVILYDSIQSKLLLDTGSRGMLNLWRDFASQHQELNDDIPRGGHEEMLQLFKYPGSYLYIDSVRIDYPATFISEPIDKSVAGICDGMLCPDYRREKKVWYFDFGNNVLTLRDSCDIDIKNAAVFPMSFSADSTILFIEIPLKLSNLKDTLTVNAKYIFDTGTPYSIIYNDHDYSLDRFSSLFPSFLTINSNGPFQDNIIPEFIPPAPMKTLSQSHVVINHNWGRLRGVAGTLGVDFMKHYNVWLDFREKRFVFTNHEKDYDNRIQNGLGFWLLRKADKIEVVALVEESPAAIAGLQIGDELLEFNGISVGSLTDSLLGAVKMISPDVVMDITVKRNRDTLNMRFKSFDNPLNRRNSP